MTDDAPKPDKKLDLERLSVDELRDRITELNEEIQACETELQKKSDQLMTANSLFSTDD